MAGPSRIEQLSLVLETRARPLYQDPIKWWTNKDLNLEPIGYEPIALTIVLLVQMVVRDGVEPSYVVFQTTAPTAYAI